MAAPFRGFLDVAERVFCKLSRARDDFLGGTAEAIFSEGAQWVIECSDIQFNWTDITRH